VASVAAVARNQQKLEIWWRGDRGCGRQGGGVRDDVATTNVKAGVKAAIGQLARSTSL